jgi:hypothetical protein
MSKKLFFLLLLSTITIGTKTYAQTEPTLDETVEWIRGKLIACGENIQDVQFDKSNYTLTVYYANYHYYSDGPAIESTTAIVENISSLNASGFAWDANKTTLSLTIAAANGKTGSTKYDKGSIAKDYKKDTDRGYAKFNFSSDKFGNEENLQERFTKAMKTLIKLCGGYVSTEKF